MPCGNCASGEVCNHVNGMCPSGCDPGWVGGLCSEGKSHYYHVTSFSFHIKLKKLSKSSGNYPEMCFSDITIK